MLFGVVLIIFQFVRRQTVANCRVPTGKIQIEDNTTNFVISVT